MKAASSAPTSSPNPTHLVGYKQRHCTDIFCLFLFGGFLLIYGFLCILAVNQGNPAGLIKPSDSQGNLCGEGIFASRPYELYFDISKCLTDGGLSFDCPTTKICVSVCPTEYTYFRLLQETENSSQASKLWTRQQLVCVYDFDPISDNRTIVQLVTNGLCAPYTIPSESLLGRCLPTILTNLFHEQNETIGQLSNQTGNTQAFQINQFSDVGRVILSDLVRVKESLALFVLVACILVLLYMFAVRQLAAVIALLSITLFLFTLFICSAFCWYTLYTGQDFVYEHSTVAQIVNDFIQLRTIYTVFGSITTFVFLLGLFVVYCLFDRVLLSIILLEQAANAIFSVLSTLLWSPTIILIFLSLTAATIYMEMCLSTVGRPIFGAIIDNVTEPCVPIANNWTQCQFLQQYGYNDLTFKDVDRVTRGVVAFLVDNQQPLRWFNRFAYVWLGAFLFAFEEIVLAGVFSNYYWSNERPLTYFPLLYSIVTILRYHLGSIAFGSLLIATLRYIRMILDYISKKLSNINQNLVLEFLLKCFSCLLWIFEKFLKFLNKNAYVLIASRGYSFCKATRKAFMYVVNNCLRFLVLINLTEWILFCGTVSVCAVNAYLFYQYLQWTGELDQLNLRWSPITALILITYLIASVFFSVYDMAIKTLFVCFLQDLDENDGSLQRPYAMNNELLRLVHKTNVEK